MTTQQLIEEGKKEYKEIMADVFKGRLSAIYADDWLTTYSAKLVEAAREETLKPFKGAKNPGEWEDGVWWQGRRDAFGRTIKWVADNATTKDKARSSNPEDWTYEVDANALINFLQTLATPNK